MTHLTRYYMYERIRESLPKLDGNILGISGIDNFKPLICQDANVIDSQYPDIDFHNLPFNDNIFDYVISDQVLEHLVDPQQAINESFRVLKKGGYAIHTSCFINYIHHCPQDYWRFTPEGLKYLCRDFSKICLCGGWGNRIAIILCFISDKLRFMPIPDNSYSLRNIIASNNEVNYPIVTWIVAMK